MNTASSSVSFKSLITSHLDPFISDFQSPLIYLKCDIDPFSIKSWLESLDSDSTFYWKSKDSQLEIGTVGQLMSLDSTADDFTEAYEQFLTLILRSQGFYVAAPDSLEESAAKEIHFFAATQFSESASPEDSPWKGFPYATLWIPQIEVRRNGSDYSLFVFLKGNTSSFISQFTPIESFIPDPDSIDDLPDFTAQPGIEKINLPSQPLWKDWVNRAKNSFQTTSMEKLVLAKEITINAFPNFYPLQFLEKSCRNQSNTYQYYMRLPGNRTFFGATPERLFERNGSTICCDAIAGTKPPVTPRPVFSEKERSEQFYVGKYIKEILPSYCLSPIRVASIKPIELGNVTHLSQELRCELTEPKQEGHLLKHLHPTPATCGYPAREAMSHINQQEPFHRGYYSGVLSRVGLEDSIHLVMLRCGLYEGETLRFYSGVGLLPDSDPLEEWHELEFKLQHFMKTLHG